MWSEVVWGGLEVVWWWFGVNMAGLRNIRNTNAFEFILQVFILSQKHIMGVKKVVWCGLDVVWWWFGVFWGGLGCFHGPVKPGPFLPISMGRISAPFPIKNSHLFSQYHV